MLAALAQTTLLDDVLREDPTTNALEAWMAELMPTRGTTAPTTTSNGSASAAANGSSMNGTTANGSAADASAWTTAQGLLVMSGTMGNQVAIRSHLTSPPHSVLTDYRSHILTAEAGALCMVSQAYPIPVVPANGTHLTLADVRSAAVLDTNIHHAPTRLLSLENTLAGSILPLAELRAITDWAAAHGIATHLDGARLWDAVAALCADGAFGGDVRAGLRAYSQCVDSVTVCFSKGLGAPVGSVLVGSAAVMAKARHVRKMLGGGVRMAGVIAAPARVAVEATFFGGKLGRAHHLAKRLARVWVRGGGRFQGERAAGGDGEERVAERVHTNMLWLDVEASGVPEGALAREAGAAGLKGYWDGAVVRVVCHYQITEEAVGALEGVLGRVLAQRQQGDGKKSEVEGEGAAVTRGKTFRYGEK